MPQVKQTFSLKLFASPHVNEEIEVLSRTYSDLYAQFAYPHM